MKMLMRIGLFFLTLFLGIQAVTLAHFLAANLSLPADADIVVGGPNDESATRQGGIRIVYNAMFPRSDAVWPPIPPTLRFLIFNDSDRELSCIGFQGFCADPQIRLRGLDARAWVCMNGSSQYTIKPGEFAELWVSPSDFELLPGQTEEVVIGYNFEDPSGSSHQYFAEPLVLPPEFRNAVKKYLKQYRDLEAGID